MNTVTPAAAGSRPVAPAAALADVLGQLTSALAFNQVMRDAWIAEGRRREAEERHAPARPRRPSRPGRPCHLRVLPGGRQ